MDLVILLGFIQQITILNIELIYKPNKICKQPQILFLLAIS